MVEANNKPTKDEAGRQDDTRTVSWGPRLFLAVLVGILAFFYWLLIYSGGVSLYHG